MIQEFMQPSRRASAGRSLRMALAVVLAASRYLAEDALADIAVDL